MEEKIEKRSADKAAQKILEKALEENLETVWERREAMRSCAMGEAGVCCRLCLMGPCHLNPRKPYDKKGICGANADTIAARNLARMVAAGTSAHSDHGRGLALALLHTARGELKDYQIADEEKLRKVAEDVGIEVEGKSVEKIAEKVALKALEEFGHQSEETLSFLKRAPEKRQALWKELGIASRAIDREVVEMMHRTAMGVDQEFEHLVLASLRTSLADGWGGSMWATEISDILLGTPSPIRSEVNLGVIREDMVNIVVHGHEPLLSEMVVRVARSPEMKKLAEEKGAKGINVIGLCCTGNEVLLRQGVPLAGNHLHQELTLITGAIEAMVVDVQCIMASLADVAQCFHTTLFTTSPKAKMPGAFHLEFTEENAQEVAQEIVKRAIENFPKRKRVYIPDEKQSLVAGFSHETINYMLGGRFRASYRPLNDAIIWGRIKGVAGVVGCNNPRIRQDEFHLELVKELIANNVLVVVTGCAAKATAKEGLLTPEAAELAGPGLREVCEAVGMPPVLHAGSCVDNSRILVAACEMVREGGLGDDISELPVAGAAPEWMSEKAEAIAHYFVASGVNVFLGVGHPVSGAPKLHEFLYDRLEELVGARFYYMDNPKDMVAGIIDVINRKREALGIKEKPRRVLYDMAMRRELPVE
jgi:carbon-monoxide dehydrogenase catalytic subunit